jgi:hypothetical protein
LGKNRTIALLIAAALCSSVIVTHASDNAYSIPREAAELYGDLVAMDFDRQLPEAEGAAGRRAWITHSTPHFVLLTDGPLEWSVQAGQLLELTRESFYGSFSGAGLSPAPLNGRLVWVAFRHREEFNRYALGVDRLDMSWSDGYYSTRTNRVALVCNHHGEDDGHAAHTAIADAKIMPSPRGFANLAQTTHEAAHQLAFNSGLQKRGVMYPLWASEGLATNFEAEVPDRPIGPGQHNEYRRRQLLEAVRRGGLMPLSDFVVMTRVPVNDPRATHDVYAQSWAFFQFLFIHRPHQLKKYLQELAALEPGRRDQRTLRKEFQQAFGPIARLERPWNAYLRQMTEPAE